MSLCTQLWSIFVCPLTSCVLQFLASRYRVHGSSVIVKKYVLIRSRGVSVDVLLIDCLEVIQ